MKARAVDEMMERIKKGIVLRPMKRIQVEKSHCELTFDISVFSKETVKKA